MNFEFSEDQELLRDVARKYLQEKCDLSRARAVLDSDAGYDREVWAALAEMGWAGTAVAEDEGGVGLGYLELCVIAEELGRVLAPVPFASSVYLAIEALKLAGNEAQREKWLPALAAGKAIGTVAVVERPGPLGSGPIETELRGGRLSGRKLPVPDGECANLAVVLATHEGQPALALVELGTDGVRRRPVATLDPSRGQARLDFDGAPAELLGARGAGLDTLKRLHDRAAVLFAFEQLGGAQAALDLAVAQAKERYAFGRPIGSFQAIKHRLADLFVMVELARSNCYYGAWALSHDAPELPVAAAGARICAIQANYQCSKENIQVHGGMGFTWESDCHLFYRRAKHLSLAIGGERVWKNKLIDRLAVGAEQTAAVGARDAA